MAEYKDITTLKKEIADFKRAVCSPNSDYLTGYICALSATEGMIANLPTADVVKVVRCKDCKYKEEILNINDDLELMCGFNYGLRVKGMVSPLDFCNYGERDKD